jgi:hypothetical protein
MRRWFAVLALLISLSAPAVVRAQSLFLPQQTNPIAIQSMEIDLWPEYDRPDVLVIYRITLASTVKLPAELTLRLPAAVGTPSAVAEQTANGLFNIQFDNSARDGNYQLVRFTTTLPQLQIEYYDPGLKKNLSARTFSFTWPGDYPVTDMQVKVQQPRTASKMTLEPKTGTSSTANDGLVYFDVPIGKVGGGETFALNLSYQKSDDSLTQAAAFEQVTPVVPAQNGTNSQFNFNQILPWLLGALGLLLIGGGVFWYMRSGSTTNAAPQRRRPRSSEETSGRTAGGEDTFCHQCGKKASGSDVFCRSCGAKLRK